MKIISLQIEKWQVMPTITWSKKNAALEGVISAWQVNFEILSLEALKNIHDIARYQECGRRLH